MTTEVMSVETHIADHQLLILRMASWLMCDDLIITQHVQQRSFARIIETKKENISLLIVQTQVTTQHKHTTPIIAMSAQIACMSRR